MSLPERRSDRITKLLRNMNEFREMKDIISIISSYVTNGQRLLMSYKNTNNQLVMSSVQFPSSLTLLTSPSSGKGDAMKTTQTNVVGSVAVAPVVVPTIYQMGLLPFHDWEHVPFIVPRHHGAQSSTTLYGRSRSGTDVPPSLVSWDIITNKVTKTTTPLLLPYYDSCATTIDDYIVWFGMSLQRSPYLVNINQCICICLWFGMCAGGFPVKSPAT
jgi:hypothetical protein